MINCRFVSGITGLACPIFGATSEVPSMTRWNYWKPVTLPHL